MRLFLSLTLLLVACGGDEKPPEAAKPVQAAPPPPEPVKAPEPAPAAAVQAGPYAPNEFAKSAYDKAKAAGADTKTNPKAGDAAAIAAGKARYEQLCASCHGATGMGDGVAGAALPQKPASFKHTERWDFTSVGTKTWIVQNGVMGTGMAGFVADEAGAWEVVSYLESEFASKGEPAPAPVSVGGSKEPVSVGGVKEPASVGGVKEPASVGGKAAPAAKPGDGAKTGGSR